MSEAKFTPGPWEVSVWEKNVFVHGGSHNDDIAEFNFCDEATVKITKDEAIANASLFAAAPEMYAALKAAREYVAASGASKAALRLFPVIQKIDSAMASAEGRSP